MPLNATQDRVSYQVTLRERDGSIREAWIALHKDEGYLFATNYNLPEVSVIWRGSVETENEHF